MLCWFVLRPPETQRFMGLWWYMIRESDTVIEASVYEIPFYSIIVSPSQYLRPNLMRGNDASQDWWTGYKRASVSREPMSHKNLVDELWVKRNSDFNEPYWDRRRCRESMIKRTIQWRSCVGQQEKKRIQTTRDSTCKVNGEKKHEDVRHGWQDNVILSLV